MGVSEGARHHRPIARTADFFDAFASGTDPEQLRETTDGAIADRLVHLADTEGIEAIAEVWSGSAPDSLAGCLWRLYLLRSWVYADPAGVAHEFEGGRAAQVARVVAGVADPPGPDELRAMIDEVLRGIAGGDFADVLFRAS